MRYIIVYLVELLFSVASEIRHLQNDSSQQVALIVDKTFNWNGPVTRQNFMNKTWEINFFFAHH